jgi:NAD(P)-dependent dehydrogenase (short-subunit alcohol dehydrogenase family)
MLSGLYGSQKRERFKMRYENKGVVITGAAGGIGLASAVAFAKLGANVMLADIDADALAVARKIVTEGGAGGQVEAQVCDVSRFHEVLALADAAFSKFASVNFVFNNAGVGVSGPIVKMRHSDWQWVLSVNLWGSIHGAEAFAPRMVQQSQGGHIIFNSSFAGLVYSQALGPYCVSKAGIIALAEVLRQELRANDIGVSVVCPMRIATDIGSSARNRTRDFGGCEGSPELIDPRDESLPGNIIEVEAAVRAILQGIEENELYIMTHAEGRPYVARRFEKLDKAFHRQHPLP